MSKFGMYVKFTAHAGQRDALAKLLLESAESANAFEECELYIVNISDTEPETVWVTEVWSNEAAHDASLGLDETKAAIQRAMPLIAGVEPIKLQPIGGKGL
ncbi:putative quinol monooxygenase [Paenibacillus piri]|uniref:Antibiotic biosynthesis monooxygenase n=1 Tax=Paenibacillus piri TaxID=2547395 RepID=A0A4R5KYX8_9BACL|nr:putative quinol monooxygenase [Paenibacillus piri]TDG00281.1 antibiotic biosynthesis monooxygenase [Paenibacillus piri]